MKSFPPSSSKLQPDSSFSSGALVLFENDGLAVVAVVLGVKKQGYQLLTMRGRELELKPNRLFPLNGLIPAELRTNESKAKYLLELHDSCLRMSAEIKLEELWTLVKDEGESFTTDKLASLYLGTYSLEQYLALRLALISDRIYFKRRDLDLFPRNTETVEDLKRNEEALSKKLHAFELTIDTFLKKMRDPSIPFPPESHSILQTLEELAAGVTDIDHGRLRDTKEFLAVIGDRLKIDLPSSKEKRSLALLRLVQHFNNTTNLALFRYRISARFTPEALKEAGELADKISTYTDFADSRTDLTHLNCYTIDDLVTEDMDDAISIEQTAAGYTLGIHITDVASVITPNSSLDREARRRATSLYLAGTPVNMLPEQLSLDALSLKAGLPRLAISYLFDVDRNFGISNGRIVPSIIKVARRYTYHEAVEAMEAGDADLSLLHAISATYESERIAQGAMKVSKKEVLIYPKPDGSFELHEIDEDDLARSMIGEFMVLANSLLANFAVKNRIPMVFRGQEQPEPDFNSTSKLPPEGPAYDFYLRSRLKKSTVTLHPLPHASLGLPAYLQATSPIRRYVDLLHERQILSFLKDGASLYSAEELQKILNEIEPHLITANQVSKETRRFYLLKYLQWLQNTQGTKTALSGTVVRLDGRTPLIELDTLYTTVFARLRPDTKIGDHVQLKIVQIDPEQDYLKLEQV